jgi:hypothetical protein
LNVAAFCYLGLLRFPEQLEASVQLLPEEEREEATRFLATVKDLPRKELLHRWAQLREHEAAIGRRNALERSGIRLDKLQPSLREWWVAWLAEQHG